jgi:O-antigen/teichoic acid export membrane protein
MLTHLNAAFMRAFKKVMAFSFFLNGGASFVALLCILPFMNSTELVYIPLYVQLGAIGLLSLVSTLMVFSFVKPLKSGKCPKTYRQILTESLPMMVTLAVHPLWNWGGIFILGVFVETRVVGVFQILLKCSNLIGLPIRAISTIMAPVVSEESTKGENTGIKSAIIKTSSLSLLLSLPIILGTIIFAPTIMQFFGDEFVPYALFLIGLSLAKFINACYGPMSIILLMSGHQNLQGKLSLLDLSFYLLTTLAFSYQWGLEGAVIAMFVSILFRNLLIGEWVRRIFGIYPLAILHVTDFLKTNLNKRNV